MSQTTFDKDVCVPHELLAIRENLETKEVEKGTFFEWFDFANDPDPVQIDDDLLNNSLEVRDLLDEILLTLSKDRPSVKFRVLYQLGYPIEAVLGSAPTIKNGIIPKLEEEGYLLMSGPILLAGSASEGTLMGAVDLREMMDAPAEIVVVDIDLEAIALMRRIVNIEELDQIEIFRADLRDTLRFADNSFAIVVEDFVLSFIETKLWADFFNEVYRVLQGGGSFIGTVYMFDERSRDLCIIRESGLNRAKNVYSYLINSRVDEGKANLFANLWLYRHERSTRNFNRFNDIRTQELFVGMLKGLGFSSIQIREQEGAGYLDGSGRTPILVTAKK